MVSQELLFLLFWITITPLIPEQILPLQHPKERSEHRPSAISLSLLTLTCNMLKVVTENYLDQK